MRYFFLSASIFKNAFEKDFLSKVCLSLFLTDFSLVKITQNVFYQYLTYNFNNNNKL